MNNASSPVNSAVLDGKLLAQEQNIAGLTAEIERLRALLREAHEVLENNLYDPGDADGTCWEREDIAAMLCKIDPVIRPK